MTEHDFQAHADAALADLYKRLSRAAESHDFDVDFNAGTIVVEFEEPPAKFVVSPNSPVHQVWVSAHSKSFKFDWDPLRNTFVLGHQSLFEMMSEAVSKQLDESVTL